MYKTVSTCLYTLHAWPQARKKLLVPPEFISLNLQGGANPPRNPPRVWECRRLPGAVYCNKWIRTAHPGARLPVDWTPRQQKGKKPFPSPQIFPPAAPVCVLKDKGCTRGHGAAAAQLKMFCQLIEVRFQTSTIKEAPVRRGGTVRRWMWSAVMLWEYLQYQGHCFAVGWVGLKYWLGWKERMGWKSDCIEESGCIAKGVWVE